MLDRATRKRSVMLVVALAGCSARSIEVPQAVAETSSDGGSTDAGTETSDDESSETGDGDFGEPMPDLWTPECLAPNHYPCDHIVEDPIRAIGFMCPGEFQGDWAQSQHPLAVLVVGDPIGAADPPTYPVREGEKLVVLSSGDALDVLTPGSSGDTALPQHDPRMLPAPLEPSKVSETATCAESPDLIGTGDCSNSIADPYFSGAGAFDYAELRIEIVVPVAVNALAFDVAFVSFEYPDRPTGSDIFIAWLEAEEWTGNITFDSTGTALSLGSEFIAFTDAAPELVGTGLEGHAATPWLETRWPVNAGEQITLVFAVMDLGDEQLDSAVLLDNFRWTCLGTMGSTQPID